MSLYETESHVIESDIEKNPSVTERHPLSIVVPMTCVYGLIFLTGLVGNVSTCIVIARNRAMHTATNYYLFSLAVSDLLLLVCGMPTEIYRMWWPAFYLFGDTVCFLQGLAAETSANASVLTITAFTVERYIAICHPFLSHTMSKLSRAIKFIVAIWIVATCLAVPQVIQFGVLNKYENDQLVQSECTVTWMFASHVFELSTFVVFVGPMCVITVLYLLIGVKLRKSHLLETSIDKRRTDDSSCAIVCRRSTKNHLAQKHVIKMLVVVVVAFFICWAPFHAQRLFAMYMTATSKETNNVDDILLIGYSILTYISGVLYFLSTTVNPLLYNIMSKKFREAFKSTLTQLCNKRHPQIARKPTYSTLTKQHTTMRLRRRDFENQRIPLQQYTYPFTSRHLLRKNSNSSHASDSNLPHKTSDVKNFKQTKQTQFVRNSSHSSDQSTVVTYLSKTTDCQNKRSNDGNDRHILNKNEDQTKESTAEQMNIKQIKNENCFINEINEKIDQQNCAERKNIDTKIVNKQKKHGVKKKFKTKSNQRIVLRSLAQKIRASVFKPISVLENTVNDKILTRQTSKDSGNTISNSSLQDIDENEYTSLDLAKYMAEINHTIA